MQPGFLLKKQEGEDEDVHEERRFRAHMEEALKNSLMDEVDDSFNPRRKEARGGASTERSSDRKGPGKKGSSSREMGRK